MSSRCFWRHAIVGFAVSLATACAPAAQNDVSNAAPQKQDVAQPSEQEAKQYARLGRNVETVSLISHDGEAVAWGSLSGKPRVVFFGFASCPEICPTTLLKLDYAMNRAGLKPHDLSVDLVTIDPERDDAATLKAFVSHYAAAARGWTGSKDAIDRIARAYRVYYAKTEYEGGYTMDHSTGMYLLDRSGAVVDVLSDDLDVDEVAERLKRLSQI